MDQIDIIEKFRVQIDTIKKLGIKLKYGVNDINKLCNLLFKSLIYKS